MSFKVAVFWVTVVAVICWLIYEVCQGNTIGGWN